MLRRLWFAATAAAAAALYFIHLVFHCSFRGEKDKNKQGSSVRSSQEQHLLDEEQNDVLDESQTQQQPYAEAAAASHAAERSTVSDSQAVLLVASSEGKANGSSSAAPSGEAKEPSAQNPGTPAPKDNEPVDVGYLQGLLDEKLGQPKFAVPKSAAPMQHEDSLKALLDKEFGPPKFAVQKHAGAHKGETSPASTAPGLHELPGHEACSKSSLLLTVTAGPATGATVQSTEDQAEIVIGRLPTNTLPIIDQEVSGRHAIIQFDPQQECWTVMDPGSLNGSVLNGMIISTSDRKPGKQHVLADQDVLELGGVTKIKVTCTLYSAHPSKKHAAGNTWGPGTAMPSTARHQFHTAVRLPPLMHEEEFTGLQLHMAVHHCQGTDHVRTNTPIEDVVHFQCPFEPFGSHAALLCLFDGHHGSQAATRAKALLPNVLVEKLQGDNGGTLITGRSQERQQQLLREVFLETDKQVASDEGCTATVVLLQKAEDGQLAVQTANVGDSSTLVVNTSTGSWRKLTADHRIANSSSERQRLQERGHTVKKRLYGLNISRMLGDKFLKDEDLGFIAEPHISSVEQLAAEHGGFIVVATDGLWDVLSEERAAQIVLKAFAEDADTTTAKLIADMLLSQALSLRSGDDITIVVVEKKHGNPCT